MATTTRRMKDFQRCLRTIQSFSDNQAHITEWDDTSLEWVVVQIRPKDGYYAGGEFDFKIFFEKDFPKCPPRVDCVTPIYHPNIDTTCSDYNVCLNLFDSWEATFGLEDIVQGLLFLMYNPNVEDPLSPYFDPSMEEEEFQKSVELSLQGEEIEGAEEFPKNQSAEVFDEEEISRSIDAILEKARQMELTEVVEEEEEVVNDEESVSEGAIQLEEAENIINSQAECLEDQAPAVNRQESKVDKIDIISPSAEDFPPTVSPERENPPHQRNISRYFPRTYITPQPDFLVNFFMTCVDIATR